jgi:hypothetical protein
MWRLSIERDTRRLADLLDDSFVLVHMTGRHQSKAEFLASVGSGELAYFDEVEESCVTHADEDTATLTGKSLVEASPFGSGRSWWRLRLDIDFVRRDGRWLMRRSVASMY